MTKPPNKNEEALENEDYASLLDQYQFSAREMSFGSIVHGRIVRVTPTHILVDVGHKSEGMIPVEEFDPHDLRRLKPGDTVDAVLERSDPREGAFILSKRKADTQHALDNLEKAFQARSWITGKVVERAKNGYVVNVGIMTFLPDSHADLRMVRDPASLIGNAYKFKVIKFDRKTENAVLSRKLFLQEEREKKKKKVFGALAQGQKLKGTVRSLTSFGAFVDIGGVEGLLHISDMSWGKLGHPSEALQVGQEVEVVVLDFNEKEERISLGTKQLTPDPWSDISEKYFQGQRVRGKVVSLTDFGAFIELEKGVEGLVHISDLSWSRKLVHPKKVLSVGQEVEVTILDVNPDSKRISLGLKQIQPHPLEVLKQKIKPGSRVKGRITSITDFGAFLEVEPGIEGLIHISDLSWEKVKHPSDKLKVGDEAEAVVLNIDVEKQKVSLGIKQLQGDIWEDFFARHKTGDLLNVKIVRLADFGVFVEVTPGIEGVVFLSELDERRIDNPAEAFSAGEEKTAKIIKMSAKDKKLSLSFRQAQAEMQRLDYQKFMSSQDDRLTLGDLMKDKLESIKSQKLSAAKKEGKADD
ncbi:MAG: 30S ribosomal protein S1 [Candidatus Aminicenantes bacterium RBG_13_63_10]|nr:MAG: 30S ribosomal protein S1 [Candidatus Aminicenantes bacterium RBG_13_63_10]